MEKQKILIILLIGAVFIVFGFWTFWVFKKPFGKCREVAEIISTNPFPYEKNVGPDTEVFLALDNSANLVNLETLQIEISPSFEFKLKTSSNIIKIIPSLPLEKEKDYNIKITAKDPKCQQIINLPYEIKFSTGTSNNYSESTGLYLQQKNLLPVVNQYFNLDYWREEDVYMITINSKNCEKAKNMALNYLEKNGVNLKKINISWFPLRGGEAPCIPQQ